MGEFSRVIGLPQKITKSENTREKRATFAQVVLVTPATYRVCSHLSRVNKNVSNNFWNHVGDELGAFYF
jgi:hypothetical protein